VTAPAARPQLSRPEERTRLPWAGHTVFDVVLGGAQTAGSSALLASRASAGT
jgi:hypothetical protein